MKAGFAALALAVLVTASPRAQQQDAAGLDVRAVRYQRAGGQTLFEAFFRVPFTLLDPLTIGVGGSAAYRVTVVVRDSGGLELLSQSWSQQVPTSMLGVPGAAAGESFTFAGRPGQYTVDVTLTDSATGRVMRERTSVTAFDGMPGASDLLLATRIRQVAGPGDTVPRRGEIRKGSVFLQAASRPALTPQDAQLGYYLEVYRAQPETVTVTARVESQAGGPVVSAAPQRIPLGAGGGATRGLLNLAGLPPGEYRLALVVQTSDTTLERRAPFGMTGFETASRMAAVAPRATDAFATMSEAALDTVYMPLIYLMEAEEQGVYPGLSVEGKRTFLRQFWARRDPTPGTPRNEAQEDFYSRIAEANQLYREGGAAQIPGWRTDRGRVFIKYGAPDEVLSRPQAGSTAPYEVWKYTRDRLRKYVFLDQTRFGNYALIWTDDRREPSRPNWQELLGPEAVLDVERF